MPNDSAGYDGRQGHGGHDGTSPYPPFPPHPGEEAGQDQTAWQQRVDSDAPWSTGGYGAERQPGYDPLTGPMPGGPPPGDGLPGSGEAGSWAADHRDYPDPLHQPPTAPYPPAGYDSPGADGPAGYGTGGYPGGDPVDGRYAPGAVGYADPERPYQEHDPAYGPEYGSGGAFADADGYPAGAGYRPYGETDDYPAPAGYAGADDYDRPDGYDGPDDHDGPDGYDGPAGYGEYGAAQGYPPPFPGADGSAAAGHLADDDATRTDLPPLSDPSGGPGAAGSFPADGARPGEGERGASRAAGSRGGDAGRAPRRSGRRLPLPLIAGAVALVVLVALGLWVWRPGGGGEEGGGEQAGTGSPAWQQAWATEPPAGDSAAGGDLLAAWTTGELLVRVDGSGARGYRLDSGELAWSAEPPAEDLVPCAAAATPAGEGVGAVLYGKAGEDRCSRLVGLNLADGTAAWNHELDGEGEADAPLRVTANDSLVVALTPAGMAGYRPADGERAWAAEAGDNCGFSAPTAGATAIIAQRTCYTPDREEGLRAVNAENGETVWTRELAATTLRVDVLSVDPVVVRPVDSAAEGNGTILTLDGEGQTTAELAVDQDFGELRVNDGLSAPVPSVVAGGGTIVTTTLSSSTGAAELVAVDAASGQVLWHRAAPEGRRLTVVAVREDSVLAVADATAGEPAEVIGYALTDGQADSVALLPQDAPSVSAGRALAVGEGLALLPRDAAARGVDAAVYGG
ncbi:outer membrane protein assembly factor BamB family protein [Allostreptomyces psammosilenae]|uniref:Outer membrane protein assembly factor BamB n=1 Tax=Allostreptomyces psammosilenae TaxID=1892865 RepID=A0A852ZLS1_9ACTN|nr:PQQ-binding-like beta-propeller repeat protein [Allostreptomyces psammosilenae]NYI03343.1 outer membrane protein assembly factor BamB [Allostreptomyces psammosilenae]